MTNKEFNFTIFTFSTMRTSPSLKNTIFIAVLISLFNLPSFASFVNEPVRGFENLKFENHTYKSSIRTIQVSHSQGDLLPPYLLLGSNQSLAFRFDDLDGDYKDYYYTLIHCSAEWEPSDLYESDYIQGFYEQSIDNVDHSFNTYIDYTHYNFQIPNNMMEIKISGNYLVVVYDANNPEEAILTRRIVVFEQLVGIATDVSESGIVADRRYNQRVNVTLMHPNYDMPRPYTDLHLSILQNNRWDNAILDLQPRFVYNNQVVYDYSGDNEFEGGNEYRPLDLKSMRYVTIQMESIKEENQEIHVHLLPDESRGYKNYVTLPDINGKYIIKNDEGFDEVLEAEYVYVHFRIPFDFNINDAGIYVFGAISDYSFIDRFRMEYNNETRGYEKVILIKQGYYDYHYLTLRDNSTMGSTEVMEGNHFETNNDYAVFAYYFEQFIGYDRVVGATFTDNYNN